MDIAGLIEIVKKITIHDTDSLVDSFKKSPKENLSISQKSKLATFQFPVLVSNTISLSTLNMISKALERQYSSFILISTGLDSVIDTTKSKNALNYLNKMHQNMNFKNDIQAIKSAIYSEMQEADLMLENDELVEDEYGLNLQEASKKTAKRNPSYHSNRQKHDLEMKKAAYTHELDMEKLDKQQQYRIENDNRKFERDKELATYKSRLNNDTIAMGLDPQLVDNDVKKSNELVPTILRLTLVFQNTEKGGIPVTQNIFIGIKTISHLVPSEEIVHNIYTTIKEKRAFFNFIRWTTGEIRFWKDFVANLDEMKKQALAERKNSVWWRAFKNRAYNTKVAKKTLSKNRPLPNACIMISMDEVEYISNTYNINLLKNYKAINVLMQEFALLSFVIVDEASEIAYFFFDGDDKYQTYGFNSLERENKNTNNEIKSIISLLGR